MSKIDLGIDFSSVVERINEEMQGCRKVDWAKKVGVSKNVVTNIHGSFQQKPSLEYIIAVSKVTGKPVEYYLWGEHEASGLPVKERDKFSYIPLVKAQLSGGDGSFIVSEDVKEYCAFRTKWLQKKVGSPEGKYLLGVVGDSMSPTINNGDTVMLDTCVTQIFDGNIYALRMDSTIMIKRLALLPDDKVRLISDNKTEYDPIDADRKDVHVLGRVVWFARTLVKPD